MPVWGGLNLPELMSFSDGLAYRQPQILKHAQWRYPFAWAARRPQERQWTWLTWRAFRPIHRGFLLPGLLLDKFLAASPRWGQRLPKRAWTYQHVGAKVLVGQDVARLGECRFGNHIRQTIARKICLTFGHGPPLDFRCVGFNSGERGPRTDPENSPFKVYVLTPGRPLSSPTGLPPLWPHLCSHKQWGQTL